MPETLEGKQVLVTGADGFIGSHLVEGLLTAGARVRALVFYNSWNEIGWLREIPAELRREIDMQGGDIRDAERVRNLVAGCDYVFHLSSLIAIPYSYLAPRSYAETNIMGAVNVLEACRVNDRLVRLVHVSTSEVYGTAQYVPIDEAHPVVGQSPYSASKIGADQIADSYHRSFGLPVVTARPFNTYGPRQSARAVIPTIAMQLATGIRTLRLGKLTPTRDFNYATDTAAGMIALALCGEAEGRVVNIGSGEEHAISEVVERLAAIAGGDVSVETEEARLRPEKSEVERLLCDNRLVRSLTGWAPAVDFQTGLERTYDWVAANLHHFDAGRYNT